MCMHVCVCGCIGVRKGICAKLQSKRTLPPTAKYCLFSSPRRMRLTASWALKRTCKPPGIVKIKVEPHCRLRIWRCRTGKGQATSPDAPFPLLGSPSHEAQSCHLPCKQPGCKKSHAMWLNACVFICASVHVCVRVFVFAYSSCMLNILVVCDVEPSTSKVLLWKKHLWFRVQHVQFLNHPILCARVQLHKEEREEWRQ